MKPFLPPRDRETCLNRFGNMSQAAGLRRYVLCDGRAAGVEAVDVDTGGGLSFTVLPGRGMDIAWARYRGAPVSYITKAGVSGPAYLDRRGMQWLGSFFAGLLTTCGMQNGGPPCEEEHPVIGRVPYGLHGDVSNTGADNVCLWEEWTKDGYRMLVTGRVQEGRLHAEHLSLRREISATLGEKRFFVHDTYTNETDIATPLMFFYHINLGYPVLDEGARFVAPSLCAKPVSPAAKAAADPYDLCRTPVPGVLEQQFYHTFAADATGRTVMALVNDGLELGVYLRYSVEQMPCFAQWKVGRTGEYVFAFEPGNCHPIGREAARANGTLPVLAPFASHEAAFELGILDGPEEIAALRDEVARLKAE